MVKVDNPGLLNVAFILSLVFAALLSACGGGGGGSTALTSPAILHLSNFQMAAVEIGQVDFTSASAVPAAANTVSHPYGNAVTNGSVLYLPDYGNNRVLGFNSIPTANNASADFVLGQPDFVTTTGGWGANQMQGPQTVLIDAGKLLVDEYGNNRILIWNSVPTTQAPADLVVGQAAFGTNTLGCTQAGLYSPESMTAGGKLIVADSNNNRIMIWNSIPTTNGVPADLVLGQADFTHCAVNAGGAVNASTLNYPSGIWTDGTRLVVADANNNRVLIWNTFPTANNAPADLVLGQADFTHTAANDDAQTGTAGAAPTARTLNYPYHLASNGVQLFLTDSSNNRVLVWNSIPTTSFSPAAQVLGQADFTHSAANDDNHDGIQDATPSQRTVNYPAGLYAVGTQLFVADEGNNRWLIFNAP
jgi:hypothetical protein